MNTTNILLATTSLLIVVAFGLSFQGFSKDRKSPKNQDELALLKQEMDALAAERRAFELSQLRANATPPVEETIPESLEITPATTTSAIDDEERTELEDRIAELEKAREALEKENEDAYEERNKIKAEQMAAAKRVEMALDMGTVVSANKESGFVVYKPSASAPTYQPGKILSVRRNSGVLGEIQIDRLDESGQYIATMRPQVFAEDGYPDIIPGDTIIDYRKP